MLSSFFLTEHHFIFRNNWTIGTCQIFYVYVEVQLSYFHISESYSSTIRGDRAGTVITVSKLSLKVGREDDGADVKCTAHHPALIPNRVYPRLQDQTTLSILCK